MNSADDQVGQKETTSATSDTETQPTTGDPTIADPNSDLIGYKWTGRNPFTVEGSMPGNTQYVNVTMDEGSEQGEGFKSARVAAHVRALKMATDG